MTLLLLLACGAADDDSAAVDTGDTAIDTVPPDSGDTADTGGTGFMPPTGHHDEEPYVPTGGDVRIDVDLPSLYLYVSWLPDPNGDGRDALIVGRSGMTLYQCAAADPVPPPGTCRTWQEEDDVRILYGREGEFFSLASDADRVLDGNGAVGTGFSLADMDGDGVAEIVTSAPYSWRGGDAYTSYLPNAGELGIYRSAAPADAPAPETAVGGWVGTPESWLSGVGSLGDLDGDGRDDLLANRYLSGWNVLPGDTWGADYPVAPEHPLTGLDTYDYLTVGDVDGDGLQDLVMGGVTDRTALTIAVWPGAIGSFDISFADADTLVYLPELLSLTSGSATSFDADGDGYADVWFSNPALAADGSALGRGEVLGEADLLRLSDADNVSWSLPSLLGDGEDARLVARFYRTGDAGDVEAKGILSFPASAFGRGATLDAETGTLLYDDRVSTIAAGDWNGNGLPDLALGVAGDYVDVTTQQYAPEQFVLLLLDP